MEGVSDLDAWLERTQRDLKRGGAEEIAHVFRMVGEHGLTDALDLALSTPGFSIHTPLIMEHVLLGAIAADQRQILAYIFMSNQCRIRLCHIKEAVSLERVGVLERCAQHRHTHPFSLNELAGAPTLVAAMKTGNIALLDVLDRNVSILSCREFGLPELQTAVQLELWEVVEWLVDIKKQSLDAFFLDDFHAGVGATLIPWFIKRGAGYSAGILKSLLIAAECDYAARASEYPYEYWLADTLMTHYRTQLHQRVRRDHQFYADTCDYPRIWKWGLENGIKFPKLHANWMNDASIHPECRVILQERGLVVAKK